MCRRNSLLGLMVAESEEPMPAERGQSNSGRGWKLKSRNTGMKQRELSENGMRSTFSDVLPLAKSHFLKTTQTELPTGDQGFKDLSIRDPFSLKPLLNVTGKKEKSRIQVEGSKQAEGTADLGLNVEISPHQSIEASERIEGTKESLIWILAT